MKESMTKKQFEAKATSVIKTLKIEGPGKTECIKYVMAVIELAYIQGKIDANAEIMKDLK